MSKFIKLNTFYSLTKIRFEIHYIYGKYNTI